MQLFPLVEAGDDSCPNPPLCHNNKTKATTSSAWLLLFCWWKRVDSDHRSETQQIYSLPPLATRERFLILSSRYRERACRTNQQYAIY